MLSVNMQSLNSKQVILRRNLSPQRFYISKSDLTSYPSRLVFVLNEPAVSKLRAELSTAPEELIKDELVHSDDSPLFLIVPFMLGKHETHMCFSELNDIPNDALYLNLDKPFIFINGKLVKSVCDVCDKQQTLQGKQCPDFVEDSYACLTVRNIEKDGAEENEE